MAYCVGVAVRHWSGIWIYFTAAIFGMLAASAVICAFGKIPSWHVPASITKIPCAAFFAAGLDGMFLKGGQKGKTMNSISTSMAIGCAAIIFLSGCANLQVAGQVQAGRNALQTGRPQDAVSFLTPAAASDPGYRIPYRIGVGVLTYLGRAYYEIGRDKDAQTTLENALKRDPDDHLARLYLGLSRLRSGNTDAGRQQAEAGLKGLHETLDYLAADNVYGLFWDPAGTLRAEIRSAMSAKATDAPWVAAVERIGREFDEEIDEARQDEVRTRSRSSGGGD